ncbi:MAG: hypothetical protein LBU82_06785 [Treponema sp.]|nr:hypothetical protein [Treponema sp.]
MFLKKTEKSPDAFWREYEEKTGEKVLARSLGRYISGWEEFDANKQTSIWGLIIASSGGFRFHHFPQTNWIDSLLRAGSFEQQKELTIFIPKEKIVQVELIKETRWWKKILNPSPPRLIIQYKDEQGVEKRACFETEYNSCDLPEKLKRASSVL